MEQEIRETRQELALRLTAHYTGKTLTLDNFALLFPTSLQLFFDAAGDRDVKESCVPIIITVLDHLLRNKRLSVADEDVRKHICYLLKTSAPCFLQIIKQAYEEQKLLTTYSSGSEIKGKPPVFDDPLAAALYERMLREPSLQLLSISNWPTFATQALIYLKELAPGVIPLEQQRHLTAQVVKAIVERAVNNPFHKPKAGVKEHILQTLPATIETLISVLYPHTLKAKPKPHVKQSDNGGCCTIL